MSFSQTLQRLNAQAEVAEQFRAKQAMRAGLFGRSQYGRDDNDGMDAGRSLDDSRDNSGRVKPAQN